MSVESWTTVKVRTLAMGCFLSFLVVMFNYNITGVKYQEGGEKFQVSKEETITLKNVKIDTKKKLLEQNRSIRAPRSLILSEADFGNTNIEYVPIDSTCEVPADRKLDGYRNLCWCSGNLCNRTSQMEEQLVCAPRITLLGVRKSGTTDMSEWFRRHSATLHYNVDFTLESGKCITEQVSAEWKTVLGNTPYRDIYLQKNSLYNDAPGQILQYKTLGFTGDGKTLRVQTGIQHLQAVRTNETRYVMILRDPAERVISQLYEWNKQGLIPELRGKDLTAEFIHNVVIKQLKRTRWCFWNYGPRACIYMSPAFDGNQDALLLWGLYVEYLESAYHFIPREQLMVVKLDEYSKNETEVMKQVFAFAGLSYQNFAGQERVRLNMRSKRQPVDSTLNLLREFYRPFNRRLTDLLNDTKWCFYSC